MTHTKRERGFSLVELLMVVAIIGVLASIAIPSYQRVRINALETRVVADLKAMATTQEMFYLNPVFLSPSSVRFAQKRYAKLHELNSFARNAFGKTTSTYYIYQGAVRYSMIPLWPTDNSLVARYRIQARGIGTYRFIFQIDESGKVARIR